MDLLAPFKKAVNKVKQVAGDVIEGIEQDDADGEELEKWKKKLAQAQADFNIDIMDQREYIYLGTRTVDKNVNTNQAPSKYANTVYNIVFEFIETQVNTQIPQPSVKSMREPYEEQAHMIEDCISDKLKQMDTEDVTDACERITPVQGYSIMELCWNNDKRHHLYDGEMELHSRHPKQFIYQPGTYRLKNSDYAFVLSKVTNEYFERRYGVDLQNQTEQYPDNTSLAGVTRNNNIMLDRTLTECVAWYVDEDGDIGKFTWVNNTMLENLPKYYYHRNEEGNIMEMEILERDTEIGSTEPDIQMVPDPVTGQPMPQQVGMKPIILPAGTQVPYYVPDCFPFVIRRNVPKNFDFGGQSDLDVIRDHQDTIKKVVTKMEEKIIKGGSIIKAMDDHNVAITDQINQVIKGTAAQLTVFGVENLQADIQKDIEYTQVIYKQAQSMLGITDSFQGKEDSTAQSGKAKQIQVQQASGRLQSKQFNKNAAYKELFELMFQFMLAFYDEKRPYTAKDQMGNTAYKEFDKYKFLLMDEQGEFYYNTDFLFSSDVGSGLPKDPIFMYNQVKEMLQVGAIDQLQYWTILEYLNFPMAKQIKAQIEQQQQQQAQMQQQQMEMQQQQQETDATNAKTEEHTAKKDMSWNDQFKSMSPEQKDMFHKLPKEDQDAIKQQIGA
jgi:hypothetical protein